MTHRSTDPKPISTKANKHIVTTWLFARRGKSTAPVRVYAKLDICRQPRHLPESSLPKRSLPPQLTPRNKPHAGTLY